jgi:ATP-dependent DNA ligase
VSWSLPDPALTAAVDCPDLPANFAAEPKWDGYRALVHSGDAAAILRSRRGTSLTLAFPDITAAAASLPPGTALDGEIVIWRDGRLAFDWLQERMNRRAPTVAQQVRSAPAHFVAFDVLRLRGTDLTGSLYTERRVALEQLLSGLGPPWTLCPSTTDPATARGWLKWASVGMEGLVFKCLTEAYPSGRRSWRKYRSRSSTEVIVGAVTGTVSRPSTVLLGRFDAEGRLQYAGRTVPLSHAACEQLGPLLASAPAGHPWEGWSFSASWGARDKLDAKLVNPVIVAEVSADVAFDAAGRWRHPVRFLRGRTDMAISDVPRFGGTGA